MSDYRTGSCHNCCSTPTFGYLQEYKCLRCGETFCDRCFNESGGCPHCGNESYMKWHYIQN